MANNYYELLNLQWTDLDLYNAEFDEDYVENKRSKVYRTASRQDQISYKDELLYRIQAMKFLFNLIALDRHSSQKQVLASTAIILMHRFYVQNSLKPSSQRGYMDVAPLMYWMAADLLMTPINLRRVVSNYIRLKYPTNRLIHSEKAYKFKSDMMNNEARQLYGSYLTNPDVHVPQYAILQLVQLIEKEPMGNIKLVGTAYRLATDILIVTDWAIRFNHVAIATATVNVAAFFLNIEINDICSELYVDQWYDIQDYLLTRKIVEDMTKEFLTKFANEPMMHVGSLRGIDVHKKLEYKCVPKYPARTELLEDEKHKESEGEIAPSGDQNDFVDPMLDKIQKQEVFAKLVDDRDIATREAFFHQAQIYDNPNPRYLNWVDPYNFPYVSVSPVEENTLRRCRSELMLWESEDLPKPAHSFLFEDLEEYKHSLGVEKVNFITDGYLKQAIKCKKDKIRDGKLEPEERQPKKMAEKLRRHRAMMKEVIAEYDRYEYIERLAAAGKNSTYIPFEYTRLPDENPTVTTGKSAVRDISKDHLYSPTVPLWDGVKLLLKRGKEAMIVPEDIVQPPSRYRQHIIAQRKAAEAELEGKAIEKPEVVSEEVDAKAKEPDVPKQYRIDNVLLPMRLVCLDFFESAPGNSILEVATHIVNKDKKESFPVYMQLRDDAPKELKHKLELIAEQLTPGKYPRGSCWIDDNGVARQVSAPDNDGNSQECGFDEAGRAPSASSIHESNRVETRVTHCHHDDEDNESGVSVNTSSNSPQNSPQKSDKHIRAVSDQELLNAWDSAVRKMDRDPYESYGLTQTGYAIELAKMNKYTERAFFERATRQARHEEKARVAAIEGHYKRRHDDKALENAPAGKETRTEYSIRGTDFDIERSLPEFKGVFGISRIRDDFDESRFSDDLITMTKIGLSFDISYQFLRGNERIKTNRINTQIENAINKLTSMSIGRFFSLTVTSPAVVQD